jgi:S1-C subfamily serine protease
VVDARGDPVRGARIGLGFAPAVVAQGQLSEGFVLTDASGRFDLGAVEPGAHTISAYADGVGRGALDVEVEEGRDLSDLRVVLDEPADDEGVNLAGGGLALTLGERDTRAGTLVVVVDLAPGGEAERAGLEPGDVIESIDGKRVSEMKTARKHLQGRVGADVVIAVRRDGKRVSYRVRREGVAR